MDAWRSLGVFLLGTGAGAVATAAYYSAQIRELKQLIESASAQNVQEERLKQGKGNEKRKSA